MLLSGLRRLRQRRLRAEKAAVERAAAEKAAAEWAAKAAAERAAAERAAAEKAAAEKAAAEKAAARKVEAEKAAAGLKRTHKIHLPQGDNVVDAAVVKDKAFESLAASIARLETAAESCPPSPRSPSAAPEGFAAPRDSFLSHSFLSRVLDAILTRDDASRPRDPRTVPCARLYLSSVFDIIDMEHSGEIKVRTFLKATTQVPKVARLLDKGSNVLEEDGEAAQDLIGKAFAELNKDRAKRVTKEEFIRYFLWER